jgi:RND family efflux transporter MFP subunit
MTTSGSESNEATVGSAEEVREQEAWARLGEARDPEAFCNAWLNMQSRVIGDDAVRAVVVLGAPEAGPFAPVAVWPSGTLGSPWLVTGVEQAISRRTTIIERGKRSPTEDNQKRKLDVVSHPLIVDGQVCGAASFEIEHRDPEGTKAAADQLKWGTVWLEALVRRNKFTSADRMVTVLELIATSLHHDRFQASATAVATELAGLLNCDRVSIGFMRGKHTRVRALSNTASFGKKANVIRAIEATMDEAIDQQAAVLYPAPDGGQMQVVRAHEELSREHGARNICTIPMAEGEDILGAITLERSLDEPFDSRTVQLCEHVAALVGPVLDVKRKDDRWLIQKAGDSLRNYVRKLVGPRHTALKLISYSLLFLLVFFIFAKGDYRVTADARLEGAVQRAVAAPLAGYVAVANVRAGDIVKEGDPLFSLDDRDLVLERLKWLSQKSQYVREYNEATAAFDRARATVLAAQVDQAEAQVELIEEQLQRVRVTAPFDGVVVSGDLSQSLGVPVERGDVLFELAPLAGYRVILEVEERDIGQIQVGQTGALALTGLPGERLPIEVQKITPVSIAEEGKNYFRVEADLDQGSNTLLRPGMEGVGKVEIDRRRLIWIWTHKITYWLRMFFWSWWP